MEDKELCLPSTRSYATLSSSVVFLEHTLPNSSDAPNIFLDISIQIPVLFFPSRMSRLVSISTLYAQLGTRLYCTSSCNAN